MYSLSSSSQEPRRGFTLVEVMASLLILGLLAGAVTWGLNQLNAYATSSRILTVAQTLAQNHIDQILTKGPFNPHLNPPDKPTPDILQLGTYWLDPTVPGTLYDQPRTVALYTDPLTNSPTVTGTIATTITNPGFSQSGTALQMRQATVTVAYNFRGKNYSVVMNTMRTSDQ